MLAIAGLIGPRRRSRSPVRRCRASAATGRPARAALSDRADGGAAGARHVAALVAGANLKSAWGSSMFNLAGLLARRAHLERFDDAALRRIAICAAALPSSPSRSPTRSSSPRPLARRGAAARELAAGRDLQALCRHLGARDRTAAAHRQPATTGSPASSAVSAKDRPSILNRRRPGALPLDHARAAGARGHADRLGRALPSAIPPTLQPLVDASPGSEERFGWRRSKNRGDLAIGYVIVPRSRRHADCALAFGRGPAITRARRAA